MSNAFFKPILEDIASNYNEMTRLLEKWVNINSHSENLKGLNEMNSALKESFRALEGKINEIELESRSVLNERGELHTIPSAKALHIQKHPAAPIQLFFGGHMDTVHLPNDPFQKAIITDKIMKGPGVADMKGGLAILLYTLKALENSLYRGKIGWEVLINPDEEIGSPGSHLLFNKYASRNNLGMIFEPAFADGAYVDHRKGSANLTIISKGRKAHAGRDFFEGSNAIIPLAKFAVLASELSDKKTGITLNIGSLKGGEATNVVPDIALCKLNIRAWNAEQFLQTQSAMESIMARLNQTPGTELTLHADTSAPPKPYDEKLQSLFQILSQAAEITGLKLETRPSGGVCDGSRLSAEGLPNIDTFGIVGGGLHTQEEYAFLPSLIERTQLATLFMLLYANQKHHLIL